MNLNKILIISGVITIVSVLSVTFLALGFLDFLFPEIQASKSWDHNNGVVIRPLNKNSVGLTLLVVSTISSFISLPSLGLFITRKLKSNSK